MLLIFFLQNLTVLDDCEGRNKDGIKDSKRKKIEPKAHRTFLASNFQKVVDSVRKIKDGLEYR